MKGNFKQPKHNGQTRLSYDAAQVTPKRRARKVELVTEDKVLPAKQRDKLVSDARNLRRNSPIVAKNIRTHLNYISIHDFQATTRNTDLVPFYDAVEKLVNKWAANCDVTGRYDLDQIMYMAEASRTVDGDTFIAKYDDTGKLQLIGGDRVRNPDDVHGFNKDRTVGGVELDENGRHVRYAVHTREGNGYKFQAAFSAEHIEHFGYFNDDYEAVRGISPLAPALNIFADIHEAHDATMAKIKLAAMFGVKLTRSVNAAPADQVDSNGDPIDPEPYTFNFDSGPQFADLDEGDDLSFIEAGNTPTSQYQEYMKNSIQMAIASLDMPFSFYSEDFTNYSGARQSLMIYQLSADQKRKSNQQLRRKLIVWRLQKFIDDGELTLPAGFESADDIEFELIPKGIAWIDPEKEANADEKRLKTKQISNEDLSREKGKDWYMTIDKLAAEKAYAQSKGIQLDEGDAGLRVMLDTYGIGVRSGAITPQREDEDHFRKLFGLPALGKAANTAWTAEGTRRPITITPLPEDPAQQPVQGDNIEAA